MEDGRTVPMDDARVRAPIAAVIRDLSGGKQFQLNDGTCVVGADPSCDLVIEHPTVSRTHVELSLAPQGVRVRDLGSRNGTYYLDQRVTEIVVGLGARLRLGRADVSCEPNSDALFDDLRPDDTAYGDMVGTSLPMRRLFAVLRRLEGSLATVLVEGESGVGKELVARAIHDASGVATGPFVALNCGAVSHQLVQSELFGHTRGAFSGAIEPRRGAFASADGGTLFLDEVGELPIDVQPVLLRALESGEIKPLGADTVKQVQVRVVCATNRELWQEALAGRFRQDLFYRLAVVRLTIPPLRDRRDDIPLLAERFAADRGGLPSEVVEKLKGLPWQGNVRELRNAVEAYLAVQTLPAGPTPDRPEIDVLLDTLVDTSRPYLEQRDALVDGFSRRYLAAVLAETNNNQSAAAGIAKLDRKYFRRLLSRYGLLDS